MGRNLPTAFTLSPSTLRGTKVPPRKQKPRPTMVENTVAGAFAKNGTFASMEMSMATTALKTNAFSTASHQVSVKTSMVLEAAEASVPLPGMLPPEIPEPPEMVATTTRITRTAAAKVADAARIHVVRLPGAMADTWIRFFFSP